MENKKLIIFVKLIFNIRKKLSLFNIFRVSLLKSNIEMYKKEVLYCEPMHECCQKKNIVNHEKKFITLLYKE